jgi:hypothetical protein
VSPRDQRGESDIDFSRHDKSIFFGSMKQIQEHCHGNVEVDQSLARLLQFIRQIGVMKA